MGELNNAPMRINKTEGAAGQVKQSGGPGVIESWATVGATKEFFVPTTLATDGGTMNREGYVPVADLNAAGERALMAFSVPDDFSSITEAVIVVIPKSTQAAADWDIFSDYAAVGEHYSNHTEQDMATTYNVTLNILFEVDISGILTALVASDYVGITLNQAVAAHLVQVVGVRFKYS